MDAAAGIKRQLPVQQSQYSSGRKVKEPEAEHGEDTSCADVFRAASFCCENGWHLMSRKGMKTMRLLQVDTLGQAREKLLTAAGSLEPETERVSLEDAAGRILAEDIRTREDIPAFRRSSVDGYAVCYRDTAGATESIPVFLEIVEEIQIGYPAKKKIVPGTCAYVPTGGMIPEGADAMVMVEYCELFDEKHVAICNSAAFGSFVVNVGEDAQAGELLLKRGTRIGPAQAGVLAAAGVDPVSVYVPWRVTILSTGDELIPVGQRPGPGQVRDINTWALQAYVQECGMKTVKMAALADDEKLLGESVREALPASDLILISGGSSQGKKDKTNDILDEVSQGGVFTHGLALKPGKPTILGFDGRTETLLAGLPGHPVAALTVFQLLVAWLWREKTGQIQPVQTTARMKTNLASAPGKTTCLLVRLNWENDGYAAEPILGKSGLITTMAQADGYVMVDLNREGLKNGEQVPVYRFL